MPTLLQNLRKFGNLDEPVVAGPRFEGINPDRHFRIGGFDDDEAVVKISLDNFFIIRNYAEQEWCRVAMQVEKDESSASFNVLFCEQLEKERLAAPGFSEGGKMFRASAKWNLHANLRRTPVDDSGAEVQAAGNACTVAPGRRPVKEAGNQGFKKFPHKTKVWLVSSKSVTKPGRNYSKFVIRSSRYRFPAAC